MTYDAMDQGLTETLFDFNTTLSSANELDRTEREETTQFSYDAAGRVAQMTTPRGVSTASPTNDYAITYAYDLVDRPLTETQLGVGEQRLTHFCYDTAGDLRSITKPRANLASVACGPAGAPAGTAFTDRRDYTAAHELKTSIDPSGDTESMTYDLDGNPADHTDAEGGKITNTYDGRGLVTQIVEDFEAGPPARQLTTKIAYDAVGNQKHLYSPRAVEAAAPSAPTPSSDFAQTFEYDGLDRPVRVLLPKQGSEARRYVHRRYDNVGNLTHVTVPVTESSLSTILASASETRRWVTQYEHFDTGWIRRSENQNGPVVYDYTPEGWQTSRKPTRPAGDSRDTFRTYYRDGLLETFADEKNNLVLRQWDRNGNLSFLKDSGVSSDRRPITLDIDHNGFDEVISTLAREENRHTTSTTYTYNPDGLVATRNDDREEDSQGGLVRAARRNQFTYDADGRVTLHEDFGRGSSRSDDKRITQTYFPTDREREQLVEQWIGSDASGSFEPRQTTRREYFANGLLRTLRNYGGSGDELRLRERHSLGYRDPGGVFVNGHRTSDDFFRKSPRSNVAVPARGRQLRAALALRRRRPARGGERRPRQPDVVQARRGRRDRGEAQRRDERAQVRRRLRRHADRERHQERHDDGAAVRRRGQPRLHDVDERHPRRLQRRRRPVTADARGVQLRLPQPAVGLAVRRHAQDLRPRRDRPRHQGDRAQRQHDEHARPLLRRLDHGRQRGAGERPAQHHPLLLLRPGRPARGHDVPARLRHTARAHVRAGSARQRVDAHQRVGRREGVLRLHGVRRVGRRR